MRLGDNRFYYLDGGINSEFNVVGFRKRITQTIQKLSGGEPNSAKQVQLIKAKILAALDKIHTENPNYFYKNFTYESRTFDVAYEQAQIDLFKKTIDKTVPEFITHHVNEYTGWEKFVAKYYKGAELQLLDGLPGMEDAIGFNTVRANYNLGQNGIPNLSHHWRCHQVTASQTLWLCGNKTCIIHYGMRKKQISSMAAANGMVTSQFQCIKISQRN